MTSAAVKAAVLNILSIGAAYGVIVAIFEWGWAKSAIGLQSTLPIPAYVPMLVFCIVFGLSMDYEVFLLSRVHEAWLATRDAHRSVAGRTRRQKQRKKRRKNQARRADYPCGRRPYPARRAG